MSDHTFRVVVAGGGIAGAEALLALHELAAGRVALTLVTGTDELVLPALSVAEPFALGHAERIPLTELTGAVGAERATGTLAAVAERERAIELEDGSRLEYDALLIATGATPVERVPHATTWWPRGNQEGFEGLLRDVEEGYTKRVAFVIPPGAVWPLPLYELALMAAREISGMGIDDAELTVVTPEAVPLALFGQTASSTLKDELAAAGIRLETASVARVERGEHLQIVLQPTGRRLDVQRIIALPGVEGPAIPGTTQNEDGFILVGASGQMRDSESVWAAGDAIAYPVKYGGISTQQADRAAVDIAARAGVENLPRPPRPALRGVLMTGAAPRALGAAREPAATGGSMWLPTGKVFGTYLTPFLAARSGQGGDGDEPAAAGGVPVEEPLPDAGSALWGEEETSGEYLRRLGHEMHRYEQRH